MIATVIKQPGETLRPAVAFSGNASIAAIRGVTVTARGLVPGAAALVASAALAGGVVTLALSGGSDGERYAVTVRADDVHGQTLESERSGVRRTEGDRRPGNRAGRRLDASRCLKPGRLCRWPARQHQRRERDLGDSFAMCIPYSQ